MTDWRDKVSLQEGQQLRHVGSSMKGFMQETDVDTYDVISAEGSKVGSVTVEDHIAVRGFGRTVSVCQKDLSGNVIVNESWRVQG